MQSRREPLVFRQKYGCGHCPSQRPVSHHRLSPQASSNCCIRIKRHHKAIIYGPLVVGGCSRSIEVHGCFRRRRKAKIAAFGSSCTGSHKPVGAAKGCDLFKAASY
ncbi:hypothetical protein PGR6_21000 [Pseudomonas sp. GR 6-02]|nr:hypothetical protein PGR6_21000 [Pseudomonas sp. GR 6-02]